MTRKLPERTMVSMFRLANVSKYHKSYYKFIFFTFEVKYYTHNAQASSNLYARQCNRNKLFSYKHNVVRSKLLCNTV